MSIYIPMKRQLWTVLQPGMFTDVIFTITQEHLLVFVYGVSPLLRSKLSQCSRWLEITCIEASRSINSKIMPCINNTHMEVFLRSTCMIRGDRERAVSEAYAGKVNSTWHQDYHLMVRLQHFINVSLSPTLCLYGDIDVIKFAVERINIQQYSYEVIPGLCYALMKRGLYDEVLSVARALVVRHMFHYSYTNMICLIFACAFIIDDVCLLRKLKAVLWNLVDHESAMIKIRALVGALHGDARYMIPGFIVDDELLFAAACGGSIIMLKNFMNVLSVTTQTHVLRDIWDHYHIVGSDVLDYLIVREHSDVIPLLLERPYDEMILRSIHHITDTPALLSIIEKILPRFNIIVARHKELGNTLTYQQQCALIMTAASHVEILSDVIELLTSEQASLKVYRCGIAYAALHGELTTVRNILDAIPVDIS